MDSKDFIRRYPSVFHLADAANWSSIQKHGLLSSRNLCLRPLGLSEAETPKMISSHRTEAVPREGILFRDQKPLNELKLVSCLQGSGLSPSQCYALLNERVFFWTTHERLTKFVAVYKHRPRKILEIDTYELLQRYEPEVEVCHINSGVTRMPNHYRSRKSFCTIADFTYSSKHQPAELTVMNEVPDILELCKTISD